MTRRPLYAVRPEPDATVDRRTPPWLGRLSADTGPSASPRAAFVCLAFFFLGVLVGAAFFGGAS